MAALCWHLGTGPFRQINCAAHFNQHSLRVVRGRRGLVAELVFLQKSPFAGLPQVTLPRCVGPRQAFRGENPAHRGRTQLGSGWITTDIPALWRSG